MQQRSNSHLLGPAEGESTTLGALGVRFMIDSDESGGGFSLVEHPMPPRSLGAPTHTHVNEDEYSYVLEGRVGVELGDETVIAGPGELVFKPRGVPHAFWNAGDEPARLLEIISPGGFEEYFKEAGQILNAPDGPDFEALGALMARYELDMDFDSIPRLVEQHGLVLEPTVAAAVSA
jgi:mannose-6-phosphate isomerase-like protein (cupin superfamily)